MILDDVSARPERAGQQPRAQAPATAIAENQIVIWSSPTRFLSVTSAARRFADIVNRACYRHEATVLRKNGVPVAFVAAMAPTGIPAGELAHRWALLPRLTRQPSAMRSPPRARSSLRLPIRGPERVSVLLDTVVLIAVERGTFDMPGYLAALGHAPVAIAAVTASELQHGVERARDAAIRQRRSAFVEGVLTNVPVILFGLAEARAHERISAELAAAGVLISVHDLQITATALVSGSEVATLNVTEIGRVPGLPLAQLAPFVRT